MTSRTDGHCCLEAPEASGSRAWELVRLAWGGFYFPRRDGKAHGEQRKAKGGKRKSKGDRAASEGQQGENSRISDYR